jgi:hypothetical protein
VYATWSSGAVMWSGAAPVNFRRSAAALLPSPPRAPPRPAYSCPQPSDLMRAIWIKTGRTPLALFHRGPVHHAHNVVHTTASVGSMIHGSTEPFLFKRPWTFWF